MEYEEYMKSLMEQIHNKRARNLVETEIRNHIEEQAESYEAEGMERDLAVREAVRQMGNPVDTGMELNKIHKPKLPWNMLLLALLLTVMSILMQAVIFLQLGNNGYPEASLNLQKTICYHMLGFIIMMLLLSMDYNFIARYAYALYGMYLILLVTWIPVVRLVGEYGLVSSVSWRTAAYGILMQYPILFAGIIYRNRNRGLKGILIPMCLSMFMLLLYQGTIRFLLGNNQLVYPAIAENIVILFLMLVAASWKGIFGKNRKRQQMLLWGIPVAAACLLGIYLFTFGGGMLRYAVERGVQAFVGTESDYTARALQVAIGDSSMGVGQGFLFRLNQESYGLFLLNGMFTYFGKIVGILVILVYAGFLISAFLTSLKQSNRIGFLVGMACSLAISVRFLAYLFANLGYPLWWSVLVPFFSYGKVSAVMNGIYIGLILCVYRNSSILKEEKILQRNNYEIKLNL